MITYSALIPARGGSRGIARKNIQPIHHLPMFVWCALAASQVPEIEDVVISSDNDEILDMADVYGFTALRRPGGLCQDHCSTESAVAHFFNQYKCSNVVLLQPTSPMVLPEDIAKGLEVHQRSDVDCVFSAVRTNDMLMWDEDGMYPINYDPRCRGRRQSRKRYLLHENGAFFIFSRKGFVSTGCRMHGRISYSEMPMWRSFQIDDKQDLKHVRMLMGLRL